MTDPASDWKRRLESALAPAVVTVEDESHRHAGHAGGPAQSAGGTHAAVRVVSARFEGLGLPDRHRLVYAALGFAQGGGALHALTIRALTPAEAAEKGAGRRAG